MAFSTLLLDVVPHGIPRKIADKNIEELRALTHTSGGIVIKKVMQRRGRPSAKTFLGTGKIEEAAAFVQENDIDLIVVNGVLKPHQYVHLGKIFPKEKKIWDRIDLILNIFDQHASAPEAKMQIKLARMHHEIPKIYARDAKTLFERAGAGIGTRGAGEKGIEDEKRHIRRQIKSMEEKLKNLQKKQGAQRRARKKTGMRTVALVGYTNAGKSSLMHLLTKKNVRIDNALFVTLETKIGKMWLPKMQKEYSFHSEKNMHHAQGESVLVADTIGFIQDLPPNLLTSFQTTLQEAEEADLLLHVIDISDPDYRKKIKVVEEILEEISCENIPQLYVLNKTDAVDGFSVVEKGNASFLPLKKYKKKSPVCISVHQKKGIDELKKTITKFFEK